MTIENPNSEVFISSQPSMKVTIKYEYIISELCLRCRSFDREGVIRALMEMDKEQYDN